MNKKKLFFVFTLLLLCFLCIKPVMKTEAATVKVIINGKTKSCSKKKTYCYVNGKKITIKKEPTFKYSNYYMGPVGTMFVSSSLKVTVKSSSVSELTLSYNNNVLKMTNGSKAATLNGKAVALSAAPYYVKYSSSGYKRWIVPVKSVCKYLGISYVMKSQVIKLTGATNSEYKSQVVLCLDAGHGGSDSGASSGGVLEKNLTLSILQAAKKYFDTDARFTVYYTRTSDSYPTLANRYNLANSKNADLFISIHINSYASTSVGTETLYSKNRVATTQKNGVNSYTLAYAMHQAAVAATGFPNRGLKDRPNLQLLKYSKMPACLIEYGFITNAAERYSMTVNTAKYGYALYKAIVAFSISNSLIK